MNDNTTFRNRVIGFYSHLSSRGIHVEVNKKLFDTPQDRDEFVQHLRSERDLVAIKFI